MEKGVLQVDPGVATLIRGGSIPYPRVTPTSPSVLYTVPEERSAPPPPSPQQSRSSVSSIKSRSQSRSLKDDTVISRYGSLVFHNYCPSSAASSTSPSLGASNGSVPSARLPKHRAREVQQAELLHLEDAAQVHKRLGEEICQLNGRPSAPASKFNLNTAHVSSTVFQPVVFAPHPQQQQEECFVFTKSASQPQQVQLGQIPQPTAQFYSAGQNRIIGKCFHV